jgi:SWI/SNF-related matrix-associated actin-dependent regulator 1 of chromatin subfamily A
VEILALDPASLALYNSVLATHCKKAPKVKGETDVRALRWSLFTDLRKSANHPLLLRTRHNTPEEILHLAKSFMMYGYYSGDACTLDKVKEELENLNDLDIHLAALELIEENPRREMELSRYVLEEDDLFSSAKFVRLRQLLPELISGGHRVLIFSQWTRVMDLLGILLENLGLQFLRLDGSIATSTRQALIDRFNEDNSIQVFLLSTRAGGLGKFNLLTSFRDVTLSHLDCHFAAGINLTSADTCIIHDLDFNPFNDLQAEDRCHRIGQKNKVTVIKVKTKTWCFRSRLYMLTLTFF